MPPGGAMDILFSFDTTGSMSYILEEVKSRLSDMIQRLQADIPGIRIGVIAHGDYCDEEVFYLEKHIDFTQNVAELSQFVGEVEGTGGGDQDECYELILRKANKEFTWAPVSNKVLVMIGDANPHEPDYKLNVDKINWRDEVSLLAKQGIKIYAVQAMNNDGVEDFYVTMAKETGGHYLRLENFSNICDFIMAICYRERDDDLFMNYEAEVAARQGTSGLHQDLNKMFATLRREDSNRSCKSGTSKLDHAASIPSRSSSFSSDGSSINNMSDSRSATPEIPALHSPLPMTPLNSFLPSPVSHKKIVKPRKLRQIPKKKSNLNAFPREQEPGTKFNLRKLKWTPWKLAYSAEKPDDTRKWRKMYRMNGYNRKTLFPCSSDLKVYELSVQTHPRGKLHVMYARVTAADLNDSKWSHHLFPGSRRRRYIHCRQIKRVLSQGCRVFVRKADIKKRQIKQVDNLNKYSYAWTRSISGARTPERTVVKDDKILSGMDYS